MTTTTVEINPRYPAIQKEELSARNGSQALRTAATVGFIVLCMLAAFAISHFFLFGQSLRLDEAQSIWQSSHNPRGFLHTIGQDVHLPLYGFALHFWILWLGNSVDTIRAFSLIFFLLSIPAMYLLARTSFSRGTAIFATLLLTISPFMNWYANEIRMYSLMVLCTILSQLFFLKILNFRGPARSETLSWYWVGFCISSLLGIYSHYFFWFVLGGQGLFFLLYRKHFPINSLQRFVVVGLILIAAIAPWLYYVKHLGFASTEQPLLFKPTTVNLFSAYSEYLFGFQNDHLNTIILSLWPLAVLFGFLSLRKVKALNLPAIYLFIAAIFPVTAAFLVSVSFRPIFLSRYLILATPALYIFIAWFFSIYPKPLAYVMRIVLVSVMGATLATQIASASTPVKEDYRDAAAYIASEATPQDVVALSAPFTVYPFEYYYTGSAAVNTLPIWNRFVVGGIPPYVPETFPSEVAQVTAGHQNIYLLLSYDQGYQQEVKNYFDTHYQRLEAKNFSPGMDLYVYKLRYQ